MTKGDEKILDTFLHKCIRSILKIYWPEKITNTEARRKRDGLEKISTIVKKRRWQWIGHVLRMDNNRNARTALDWAPEGKRKRGRPKATCRVGNSSPVHGEVYSKQLTYLLSSLSPHGEWCNERVLSILICLALVWLPHHTITMGEDYVRACDLSKER
jgi:hypothetical protein